jgi:hypothetical protein
MKKRKKRGEKRAITDSNKDNKKDIDLRSDAR